METNLRTKISIKDICNGFVYNDFEGKGCTKCKKFLPFEMFHKSRQKTPYSSRCKECVKKCAIQRNIEVFGTKTAPKKVK